MVENRLTLQGAIPPQKIETKGLFTLDVDYMHSIHQPPAFSNLTSSLDWPYGNRVHMLLCSSQNENISYKPSSLPQLPTLATATHTELLGSGNTAYMQMYMASLKLEALQLWNA
ncbi:hypothetical protein H0H92_013633 [Tricholoma furcatifolium]|nr:hypothetical protein H0H92_013633 [Tricholoma furcatifolium]